MLQIALKPRRERSVLPPASAFTDRLSDRHAETQVLACDVGTRPCAPPRPQILAGARLQPPTATSERPMASNRGPRAHGPQSGHSGGAGGVDLVALSLVVKWLVHQFNRQSITAHTHTQYGAPGFLAERAYFHFARHTRQTLSKPAPKSCARRAIGVGRKLVSSARWRARGASHLCAHQAGTNHARG